MQLPPAVLFFTASELTRREPKTHRNEPSVLPLVGWARAPERILALKDAWLTRSGAFDAFE